MPAQILIVVAIATMPVSEHRGSTGRTYTEVGSTWPSVTMQKFDDRPSCEHAAKQIKAMAHSKHTLRMTCQPAALSSPQDTK